MKQQLKLIFIILFFSFQLGLFGQKNMGRNTISSSEGRIEQILIGTDVNSLEIPIAFIKSIINNRKVGDTLIVFLENKNLQLDENIDYSNLLNEMDAVLYVKVTQDIIDETGINPTAFDFGNQNSTILAKDIFFDILKDDKNYQVGAVSDYYIEDLNIDFDADGFPDDFRQDQKLDLNNNKVEKGSDSLKVNLFPPILKDAEIEKEFSNNFQIVYKINDLYYAKNELNTTLIYDLLDTYLENQTLFGPYKKIIHINTKNRVESDLSLWVQDMFIPVNTKKETICLYNINNERNNENKSLLDSLTKVNGILKDTSSFNLEGGNISFLNSKIAFIGKDEVFDIHENKIDRKKLRAIKNELNLKQLFVIGSENSYYNCSKNISFQAFFHLDLYFNSLFYNDSANILLAQIYLDSADATNIEIVKNCNNELDATAIQLKKLGYNVHRIPLYYSFGTYYSYNNSIFEIYDNKTFAYVPDYGTNVPKYITDKFKEKMDALNIKVSYINTIKFIGKTGSLHCMTKVLKRI